MTFVYKFTVYETKEFALFCLMFGRVPRLLVDLMLKNVFEDVHCTMAVAQENCTAEQRYLCNQYSKWDDVCHLGIEYCCQRKVSQGHANCDKRNPTVYTGGCETCFAYLMDHGSGWMSVCGPSEFLAPGQLPTPD